MRAELRGVRVLLRLTRLRNLPVRWLLLLRLTRLWVPVRALRLGGMRLLLLRCAGLWVAVSALLRWIAVALLGLRRLTETALWRLPLYGLLRRGRLLAMLWVAVAALLRRGLRGVGLLRLGRGRLLRMLTWVGSLVVGRQRRERSLGRRAAGPPRLTAGRRRRVTLLRGRGRLSLLLRGGLLRLWLYGLRRRGVRVRRWCDRGDRRRRTVLRLARLGNGLRGRLGLGLRGRLGRGYVLRCLRALRSGLLLRGGRSGVGDLVVCVGGRASHRRARPADTRAWVGGVALRSNRYGDGLVIVIVIVVVPPDIGGGVDSRTATEAWVLLLAGSGVDGGLAVLSRLGLVRRGRCLLLVARAQRRKRRRRGSVPGRRRRLLLSGGVRLGLCVLSRCRCRRGVYGRRRSVLGVGGLERREGRRRHPVGGRLLRGVSGQAGLTPWLWCLGRLRNHRRAGGRPCDRSAGAARTAGAGRVQGSAYRRRR